MDFDEHSSPACTNTAIPLNPEQYAAFRGQMKIGIYKELHRRELLSDSQLNQLISMQYN